MSTEDGDQWYLVERPSDYLNDGVPTVVGTFSSREAAREEMFSKVNALDLHGSDYAVMRTGSAEAVEAEMVGIGSLQAWMTVCPGCTEVFLTDNAGRVQCMDCDPAMEVA